MSSMARCSSRRFTSRAHVCSIESINYLNPSKIALVYRAIEALAGERLLVHLPSGLRSRSNQVRFRVRERARRRPRECPR